MILRNLVKVTRKGVTSQTLKISVVTKRDRSVWTSNNVVVSPFGEIQIPHITLCDYVWQNLDKWPEKTAAVCSETGRGYTYELIFKLSKTFGANLRKKFNVREKDTIAVMLPNIPDYPIAVLGIMEAGGIVTTLNPIYTPYEIQRQLLLSGAKIVVTIPEVVNNVNEAMNMAKIKLPVIVVKGPNHSTPDGAIVLNELIEDPHVDKSCLKEVRVSPHEVCLLPYSSGTTGLPKGVELTHNNIMANCEQISVPELRAEKETSATHQDSIMTVLPLFHIYAITVIMFHKMANGCKMVTVPRFQPESFLQAMQKYKTNVLFTAPPIIIMMASHPAANKDTFTHLETIINGAAPLAASDADRLITKAQKKFDFRQGYGLTETSPTVTFAPNCFGDYGSVGYAIPSTELKVVDENLQSLGPNQKGELLVRGPQVMKGYKDNPEANAEAFTSDRFFRTGDLAIINEDGVVTIADRLKELIKVKGFQVPPAELEGLLREHPAVNDAAVVGVPHPTNGEAPKGFVVLNKGHDVQKNELIEFIKEKVASYKRIEDIVFVDTIPKSAAGKILRRALKDKYC